MLNEQHGNAPVAYGAYGVHQGGCFLIIHAASGLVQNHQAWVGCQRAGNFEQALVAVRKTASGLGVTVGQTHKAQFFHAAGHGGFFFCLLARGVQHARKQARLHAAVASRQHVFEHREPPEQPDGLEGAGNAQLYHLVRARAGNGLSVKKDAARFRRVVAGNAVENRSLASAVGADKSNNAARFYIKCKIVEGNQPAKHLAHFFKAQQGHAGLPSSLAAGGVSTR